jgi:hypothetical protein
MAYSDAKESPNKFCEEGKPEALEVFEGISRGWRDVYASNVTFQWVNASNVLPGEYWLREDVNPTGVIKEMVGGNKIAYATSPTIIPGFDALAQATNARAGEPKTLTLTSQAWNDLSIPTYRVISQPQHGALSAVNKNQVTFTPTPGYAGPDGFSFSAADPNSPFPRSPAVATVSIGVIAGAPTPTLAPTVAGAHESNRIWREDNRLASFSRKRKPPIGTTFSFSLNEQARVSFAFTRQLSGRRVKGKCVAETNKNRRRRGCKRTVTAGALAFAGHAGTNKLSFRGRISVSKKLPPGRYTLLITATNAAGQHSQTRSLSFTIVK